VVPALQDEDELPPAAVVGELPGGARLRWEEASSGAAFDALLLPEGGAQLKQIARQLKEAARAAGTIPLRDAALALVNAGETRLEEINRVTFVS